MSHFAKINSLTKEVMDVIVAEQDFIDQLPDRDTWVQTSRNTLGGIHYDPETGLVSSDQSKALRMNYASPGMIYDVDNDAFHKKQPFPSWSLDSGYIWQAPVAKPDNTINWEWNESTQSWDSA